MNTESSKCEYCNKSHDGSYGSGRFCSAKCARGFSTSVKRKEINQKVSRVLTGRPYKMTEPRKLAQIRAGEASHNKWLNRKVKIDGVDLDITNEELEEYRKTHTVCEICGKPEKFVTSSNGTISKLARDHNHTTHKFRGLLCGDCNRKLGWFENLRTEVLQYLEEKDGPIV